MSEGAKKVQVTASIKTVLEVPDDWSRAQICDAMMDYFYSGQYSSRDIEYRVREIK